MHESGLQMSVAKRLRFHFEATSVKGIHWLRRDPVAGTSSQCVAGDGSFPPSPGSRSRERLLLLLDKEGAPEHAHPLLGSALLFGVRPHLSSGHQPSCPHRAGTGSPGARSLLPKSWGGLGAPRQQERSGRRAEPPAPLHQGPGISILLSVLCLSPAGDREGLIRACRRSAFGSQGEKCLRRARCDGDGAEEEARGGGQVGIGPRPGSLPLGVQAALMSTCTGETLIR